jgi:hypothetical protein
MNESPHNSEHGYLLTAAIVALIGLLGAVWSLFIVWIIGFIYLSHVFNWVKNDALRFFLYVIVQILFLPFPWLD